ncbi:MAG: ArgE/DapE family deacylase [Armatimonadota bacterium]|nr:ArgE/DapE family deacylase [Armatimonadota bacterium]
MLVDKVKRFLKGQEDNTARLLCELIRYHSLVETEQEIQSFLFDYLSILGGLRPQYAPIDEDIVNDQDYTNVVGHTSYEGRNNVIVQIPGTGGGRSLILNSHSDVVPGPEEIFVPRREGATVYGRGACDAKGQIVTILLALRALQELGVRLKGDLNAQIVIEEEPGGNGSLSLLRQGYTADAAVILEPTTLLVCPANRGALWYKLKIEGKSVHMGKYWDGVNAVFEMMGLINVLRDYETKLRQESLGHPLFSDDPSPVCVNLGTISGGEWPATVAGDCVIEGGVAFLPNKRLAQIAEELRYAVEQGADGWTKDHYSLDFSRLHNDAFETQVDHPAVQALCVAADQVRPPSEPTGLVASTDARLFYHRGNIPTIVFGPGDLAFAHSAQEQIEIPDIIKAAQALTLFIMDWCGVE